MSFSSRANCDKLPEHLLELIVEKLCHNGWSPDLLNLRLVSKAWRDAVAKYGAEITFELTQATDLRDFCNSFPSLCSLKATSPGIQLDLSSLPHRSQLSSLSLTNEIVDELGHTELLIDLRLLPPSLRRLEISGARVEPFYFPLLHCTKLTRLTFAWTSNSTAEACQLLQLLPDLKVRLRSSLVKCLGQSMSSYLLPDGYICKCKWCVYYKPILSLHLNFTLLHRKRTWVKWRNFYLI